MKEYLFFDVKNQKARAGEVHSSKFREGIIVDTCVLFPQKYEF